MDKLAQLRRESYRTADEFYEAEGRYFGALLYSPDDNTKAVQSVRIAGEKYRIALEALSAYLASQPEHKDEQERTKAQIEILDHALNLLPKL